MLSRISVGRLSDSMSPEGDMESDIVSCQSGAAVKPRLLQRLVRRPFSQRHIQHICWHVAYEVVCRRSCKGGQRGKLDGATMR